MAEMQDEDIINDVGDPVPKRPLSEKNRGRLDSIVSAMIANKESDEAINAVVSDFKERYSEPEPKAFQIQISQPTFKSAPAATGPKAFTGASESTPSGQFSTEGSREAYGVEKLKGKARVAKEKLDLELHSNDAQYEQRLRELRRDAYGIEDLKKEYKRNGQIIPIGQEKEVLRAAKQRQYELPVTPEDISDMKMGTILNTDISRKFIRDLGRPEVQKNAYLVDAYNHAAQDVNGNDRAKKIRDNAEKIGKSILTYDPVSMTLGKPEGFINSIFTGRAELSKSFDLYDYIKNKPDASVLDKLNHEINIDIDEPVPVPAGKIAGVGRMMGEQPLKGMVAGGVAAIGVTAAGHPEAASTAFNLVSAGLSGIDAYKITFANATKANYAAFKQQGLSDQEALDRAKALAEDQANTDAASAVLMSAAAGKMAFKPTGLTLSTLKKSLGSALAQIGEAGGKKALEGMGIGAIGGVSQIIKNVQAQDAGLPIETTAGVKEQIEAGVLLTAATHVIAKASTSLKPSTLNKLVRAASGAPKEVTDNAISSQQEQGHITPEEAKRAQDVINDTRVMNEAIPKDIPEVDREVIADKIKERNELKAKLETIDELYHPEIKEKIKKLNEDALAISKGAARSNLRKFITKEINAGNVEESASNLLMSATEKELDGYMKDISDHANNPATEAATLATFGKEIVSKAKELYPAEKPVIADQSYVDIFSDIEAANAKKGERAKTSAMDRISSKFGQLKSKAEFINNNFLEIERQLLSSKIIEKICP